MAVAFAVPNRVASAVSLDDMAAAVSTVSGVGVFVIITRVGVGVAIT